MTTRTNLSALALKYSTLTVFFMIALVAAGIYAFFNLGRGEDPPFTIKQMVVSAAWPGATSREMEQQVTEKIETKLQELPYFYNVQSYTKPGETVIYVSLRDDTPPAKVPDLWYQVRKKVGDIKGTLPAGRQRPVLQRRVRRHLQPDLGLRVRRLLAGRGQGDRQGRAPAPAARARRHQGRPARPAGREDLHRVQPHAARHAGRAGRPDPRDRAPAERHRGDRHGRDQGRARLGPRRRRAGHGRATGRAALQRQRPHAHPGATWPRSSAATRTRSRSRCASRASR